MTTNRKEYARAYYEAHKEQYRQYQRNYWKRQAEKNAAANPWLFDSRVDFATPTREDFQAIPKATSYNKEYYEKNKERIRAQQKESRERRKRLQYQRDYYAANRDRIVIQQREYHRKKAKEKRMAKTWYGRLALKFKSLFK